MWEKRINKKSERKTKESVNKETKC
jgi:hypothetical protein